MTRLKKIRIRLNGLYADGSVYMMLDDITWLVNEVERLTPQDPLDQKLSLSQPEDPDRPSHSPRS